MGNGRSAFQISIGNLIGKRLLRKPSRRSEDSIIIVFKEICVCTLNYVIRLRMIIVKRLYFKE